MRSICTSLGTWDTIETGNRHKHGITFPLAIVGAVVEDAGQPYPIVWEGDEQPEERASDVDLLLISMMDSRHFWRVAPWLRTVGIAVRAADRNESDAIVIGGGQAASAPAPVEHMFDVLYIGEAESNLPDLVEAIERGRAAGWSRDRILQRCAALPGCLVPSHCPSGHVVQQVYAEDIGITLSQRLWVNHRKIHRVEISRGCQSKCGFCVLGWRSRYREQPADALIDSLSVTAAMGVREVHLSAGDAESHSEIVRLRQAVRDLGLRDYGWTGRMDTIRDCSVSAGKQFAFGLEGMSHRLRKIAGKPKLSNDYVVDRVSQYWGAGGRRLMFHLIGGLPGETDADAEELVELLARLDMQTGSVRQHLEVGRQPFGPLPHTPMQWFAPGLSTERIGAAVAPYVGGSHLRIIDKVGQGYRSALINSVVMRGGREVQPLVEQGPARLPRDPVHAKLRWSAWLHRNGLDPLRYLSAWDPSTPTPWSHVRSAFSVADLQAAHQAIRARTDVP